MKKQTLSEIQACTFASWCHDYGFIYEIASNSVIRIKKSFTPNDMDAFAKCDMDYGSVLAQAPLKGGSIWGTDGGSIGGFAGLKSGQFVMNKSGEGVRFMNALKKLDGGTNANSQIRFAK